MGSFKTFLNENEEMLAEINAILLELEADAIDELGHVLVENFFDDDDETSDNNYYILDDLNDMIEELGEDFYPYILDLLEIDQDDAPVAQRYPLDVGGSVSESDEDLEERVARRMSMKSMNKKKRKFMGKSKADLRKTKAARKKAARANRSSRKRYQRANKQKIAAYQKSRSAAISKGKHKVKLRRKA